MTIGADAEAITAIGTIPEFRYWAFISYSHKDEREAARLHRRLESFTAHTRLKSPALSNAVPLPKRIFPIFRDRDELGGASDLSEGIQEALRASRFLIVVCSRHSAKSKWVNEEIRTFKRLNGEGRVLAFIIDGEPNASDDANSTVPECFPEALRYRTGPGGAVTTERTEPIAADARKGKDGQRHALLKLIAGVLGVRFDDLRHRDQERAARKRNWITVGSLSATAVFAGIAAFAYYQQTIAEERSRVALSRQLAAQAMNDVPAAAGVGDGADYPRGLLLAVEAFATKPTVEARATLFRAVLASPYRLRYLWGHTDSIAALAVSPDGKLVAAAAGDGGLRLWDAATNQLVEGLVGLQGRITSIAFSPGSDVLATAAGDSSVRLWNVTTRHGLGPALTGAPQVVKALAFSGDGGRLAVGGKGATAGEISVWALEGEAPARRLNTNSGVGPQVSPIEAVAFNPDGSTLVTAGEDDTITIWDAVTMVPRRSFQAQAAAGIAFSPDGKLMATGGHSGIGTRRMRQYPYAVIVWDLATGRASGLEPQGEVEDVRSVAFASSNTLAAGAADGRVFLWDLADSKPAHAIYGHTAPVTRLAFGPGGRTLLSGSHDGQLISRELQTGAPLQTPVDEASTEAVAKRYTIYMNSALALSSDGNTLAWGSGDGGIVLWDVARGSVRRLLAGTGSSVGSFAFTQDGKTLAASTDEAVVLWDVATGHFLRVPVQQPQNVDSRVFSPDGATLALVMADHSVALWDVSRGASRGKPLRGHAVAVSDLAFAPTGKTLASASEDGVLCLWDLNADPPRQRCMPGGHGKVSGIRFSPDGTKLALIAYRDAQSTITLWDLPRSERRDLHKSSLPTTADLMMFSPDSSMLAAGLHNGDVLLWDIARGGTSSSRLAGNSSSVDGLAFSPGGDSLISVADATAVLWDVVTRLSIGRVSHSDGVRAVAFSSDSRVMVSSATWGPRLTVRDWNPASWAKYACQVANRTLTRAEWEQFVGRESVYEPACVAAR